MYLTIKQCDVLDGICNRYEVALRSYVSNKIISSMTKEEYINTMKQISTSMNDLPSVMPMYSYKFKSKAKHLAASSIYDLLQNTQKSFASKDIVDGQVISLGNLLDLIMLLYNPLFSDLGSKFDSIEQFADLLTTYHDVRNSLAHTASAKIQYEYSEKVINLITGTMSIIHDDYFWYSSKLDIKNQISEYLKLSLNAPAVLNNLNLVPKKHKELLLREKEIQELIKLICGDGEFGRVAGSVELHGYGGVGKTSLALEFCYEIIRNEMNNNGKGYSFILWLSSKTEELTFNITTGTLYIKQITPLFEKCDDILIQLGKLLDYHDSIDTLTKHLYKERTKGIVVLDNFETISNDEKKKIKELIRTFPRDIQFIITSRNFESIAEESLQIHGYSDIQLGKQFIEQYLSSKNYTMELSDKHLEQFIKHSFGNTLILVLGLERLIQGTVSFDQLIQELQLHKKSDVEIIVDFMYKNTFDTALKEIEQETDGFNVKMLLTVMLLYGEPIDFHSLRELLKVDDSKLLDYVLEKLTNKFVLNKNGGYYELHEFASKFVILKLLPNQITIKEISSEITAYKREIKENLKKLYEDKRNYSHLEKILDDWQPITEADTIAISQAYTMFKYVRNRLNRIKTTKQYENLTKQVKQDFSKIEKRSYHPYITFQKARVLQLFLRSKFTRKKELDEISKEIQNAYENAYFSINLKYKYLLNMESYAAFLWLYGLHLMHFGHVEEASRILEESVERFIGLKEIRKPINHLRAYCLLARSYALLYLRTKENQYLNKIARSIGECSSMNQKVKSERETTKEIILLKLFCEVMSGNYRYKNIVKQLEDLRPIPKYLYEIRNAIYDKITTLKNKR